MAKFIDLQSILGRNTEELTALAQGEFTAAKLGVIPFTAVNHKEYAQAKKDSTKMVKDGTGGFTPDIDDDNLMVKVILAAVDKDERSDFTFANKALLDKLGVNTAEAALSKLLSPGEIYNFAIDVQNLSGFGPKAAEELKTEVKND